MTDLALDGNFDVFLDDRNDVATVDGRAKFEQSVAVQLTSFMHDIPGNSDFNTLKERVRLQVSRVARNHEMLESIQRILVEKHPEKPGTVKVELIYESSDAFDFNLNL
jgi:hypothetical protein